MEKTTAKPPIITTPVKQGRRVNGLLLVAAAMLLVALFLPWWQMWMHAPQYPDGLSVQVGIFSVTGDVSEIDDLNHYIGFMPLAAMAPVERHLGTVLAPLIVLLVGLASLLGGRWKWLALPAVALPVFLVVDLAWWLWYAGHHLNPYAALSTSVAPWTPHLFGPGGVGQFHTFAMFGAGFWLSAAAALLMIVALVRTEGSGHA
ncbi:cytochrome C [bacterium]|nr:MAG: cytochrome C [bacterium]